MQVIVEFKNSKTLGILKEMAKKFDFVVLMPKKETKETTEIEIINGVTLIRGDRTIDTSDLSKIFSGKNMDAKKLRQQWNRRK
jgi:hypothetical protein